MWVWMCTSTTRFLKFSSGFFFPKYLLRVPLGPTCESEPERERGGGERRKNDVWEKERDGGRMGGRKGGKKGKKLVEG